MIIAEQLRDKLLSIGQSPHSAIEADTYSQLVQAGRLDRELSPDGS